MRFGASIVQAKMSQINLYIIQIPITYPATAPELALPELDGKTAKMYRGGKICLTDHFKPLWARNVPKFGIAHAMALGVCTSREHLLYFVYHHALLPSFLSIAAVTLVGR